MTRIEENTDEMLDSLLSDLGLAEDFEFEEKMSKAAEAVESVEVIDPPAIEAEIEAAKPEVEEVVEVEAAVEAVTEVAEPKAKKEKKAKAPKEPKEKKERVFYASKSARLVGKFGESLGDYLVLEVGDASLDAEALKAKQDETMEIIKGAGSKAQNRITFILEFIGGKAAKLNGVIDTAFKLLNTDGKLSMGVEGNLYKALVAHPYEPTSAKSMGGNSVLAMSKLKIIQKNEAGDFVANPNSLLLMTMNGMLGLS